MNDVMVYIILGLLLTAVIALGVLVFTIHRHSVKLHKTHYYQVVIYDKPVTVRLTESEASAVKDVANQYNYEVGSSKMTISNKFLKH